MRACVGPVCWSPTWLRCLLVVLTTTLLALTPRSAAAEDRLYPHAEQEFGPWGYIDKTGRIVIPLQFDWAEPFSEGRAAVILDKKYGYVDGTGRLVIPLQFDASQYREPPPFQGGLAAVKRERGADRWALIDRDGVEITIDRDGVPVIPPWPPRPPFSDERIVIAVKGKEGLKYGAADLSGRIAIEPEYERMAPFSEGLAAVKRGDKHGFVDKTGRLVIPFQFDGAAHFQEGRAEVMEKLPKPEVKLDGNGKYVMTANYRCGFIDQAGQLIVPYRFEVCNDFHEGRAFISIAGQGWGVINLEGHLVVPPHYTSAAGTSVPKIFLRGGSSSGPGRTGFSEGSRLSLTRKVSAISIGKEIWLSQSSSRQRLCSTMAWPRFGHPLRLDLASLS